MSVAAVNCNQESPNHKKEGEKYYILDEKKPLTSSQKETVNDFFAVFKGKRLKGESTIIDCTGPESDSKKRVREETLKAVVSILSGGEIVIDLDIYNKNKKSTYSGKLKYFDKNSSQVIKKLSNNKIHIVSKYRTIIPAYRGSRSILTEEIIKLHLNGKTLDITTTRYSSGYFSIQHKRKLYF